MQRSTNQIDGPEIQKVPLVVLLERTRERYVGPVNQILHCYQHQITRSEMGLRPHFVRWHQALRPGKESVFLKKLKAV